MDFQAFGEKMSPKSRPIDTPPFYAAQFFPLTRKSMGGVLVDLDCRVLDKSGRVVPGLFAVGEVTGFGGINGKAALEECRRTDDDRFCSGRFHQLGVSEMPRRREGRQAETP